MPRTDQEVVDQTVVLARYLLEWKWGLVPDDGAAPFWATENSKARVAWNAACHIQDLLTQTDVINAVQNLEL